MAADQALKASVSSSIATGFNPDQGVMPSATTMGARTNPSTAVTYSETGSHPDMEHHDSDVPCASSFPPSMAGFRRVGPGALSKSRPQRRRDQLLRTGSCKTSAVRRSKTSAPTSCSA
jgi:hypothetical protein